MSFIRDLFHKLYIGIKRKKQSNNDYVDNTKQYGNSGELNFYYELKDALPEDAIIKRNIIISIDNRDAEIDFIVVYRNRVYAIEVKNWKGIITNEGDDFFQHKQDQIARAARSPFRQLSRSIYLLKEATDRDVYINPVVFFYENRQVRIHTDEIWFNDVDDLAHYILNEGRRSRKETIDGLLKWVTVGDRTFGHNDRHETTGIINSYTLQFETPKRLIRKSDIDNIVIRHHFAYDELIIRLLSGNTVTLERENHSIIMEHDRQFDTYYLSKIDLIIIGH